MPFSRITALLMSAGLVLASPAHAAPQPADRIVAVVNKQAITANELNDRVKTVMRNLQSQNVPLPPANILRQQVLERLVSEAVQMQLAQDTGIRIDDNQLDRSMERIAQQNNMSLAQFRGTLEKDGMDFRKFREDIRTEIALSRLREREVDSRVIVSDAEVDNLLQQQKAKSQSELELNISHVLVQVPENASPTQVQERRARAEKALRIWKRAPSLRKLPRLIPTRRMPCRAGRWAGVRAAGFPACFWRTWKSCSRGSTPASSAAPTVFTSSS